MRSVPQAKNYQQPKPITETGLNNLIEEKLFKPESLLILDVVRCSDTHEVVPALTFYLNYVTGDLQVVSVKEHFIVDVLGLLCVLTKNLFILIVPVAEEKEIVYTRKWPWPI